jgi:tRNA (uracil-5-)-methyltransferase
VGIDDAVITGEFERLAQEFAAGATANSPSLPLTALVVQVLVSCHKFS